MYKSIEAIYENGKVSSPEMPKEKRKIRAIITFLDELPTEEGGSEIDVEKDPFFHIHELAEETGISDLAAHHDRYLYDLNRDE